MKLPKDVLVFKDIGELTRYLHVNKVVDINSLGIILGNEIGIKFLKTDATHLILNNIYMYTLEYYTSGIYNFYDHYNIIKLQANPLYKALKGISNEAN